MIVRTGIKPDSQDKDVQKAEEEHRETVKKNEAKLLAARKAHEKKMGR